MLTGSVCSRLTKSRRSLASSRGSAITTSAMSCARMTSGTLPSVPRMGRSSGGSSSPFSVTNPASDNPIQPCA